MCEETEPVGLGQAETGKVAAVENAISQAAFILECIDREWPANMNVSRDSNLSL